MRQMPAAAADTKHDSAPAAHHLLTGECTIFTRLTRQLSYG